MTAAHRDPTYQRNARTIRRATNQNLKLGREVICIGCGRLIQPGQAFDIGHRIDASRGGTNAASNLGPQHRRENRSAGGRAGAAKTNTASRKARRLITW